MLAKQVGATIRTLREARGVSQVALAKRAKIGRATLRRVEEGAHAMTLDTLDRIARALKVTVTVQMTRSEEHTSELQSLAYLVCRLLLEKKKTAIEHGRYREMAP